MQKDYTNLKHFLSQCNIDHKVDFPFHNICSLKVGGNVALYVTIETEKQLFQVVKYFIENDIEYNLIGDANNVLIADEGYNGVIISLKGEFENFIFEDTSVIVCSSVRLERLSHEARIRNLTGFEFMALLPHTIGGAIASSLNAFGESIFDNIEALRVMRVENKKISIESYSKEEYLNIRKEDSISLKILSIIFKLSYEEASRIDYKVDWYKYVRGTIAPVLEANIGPIFDDINNKAYEMVSRVGGTDMKAGYLEWHKSFPNYIINTSKDETIIENANNAIALIDETRKKIKQHYDINPELRVIVLRNNLL